MMVLRRLLFIISFAALSVPAPYAMAEDAQSLAVPAEFEKLVNETGQAPVDRLIAHLQGPQAELAATALGRTGNAKAVDALIKATQAENGELRAAAAWALGKCTTADPSVFKALTRMAADPHDGARAAALWALGRIGGQQAAEILRRGIADPDRNVRLALIRGVADGNRKEQFSVLADRLDYQLKMVPDEDDETDAPKLVQKVFWAEEDSGVRLAIIQALAELNVIDALPAIIYAMERENSFNRKAAQKAILGFGKPAASVCLGRIVPTPYDKEAFEKRMPLLINNGTLAVIAGRLGDDRCIPYLRKTLKLPTDELGKNKDLTELYINTVELLGKFKVDQAARPMAELLKQTRIDQLSEALQQALVSVGRQAARPLARNADDWRLAPIFLPLLRKPHLQTSKLRPTLIQFLQHESDSVRREATETLGLYIYEGVLDQYDIPLLEAMHLDPDRSVRQICAKWKGKIAEKFGEGSVQ